MVRAGLAPAVSGASIAGVSVLDERALTRFEGDGAQFEAALTGRLIRSAARRGKFLWLPLEAAAGGEPVDAIIGHLGMSGQLLLRPPGAPPERHERVRVHLDHPQHGELALIFADQRTFGSLALDTLETTTDAETVPTLTVAVKTRSWSGPAETTE